MSLKFIINRYVKSAPEARLYSEQCLTISRWDGNIVLIILDAAFTSTGLHYFRAVVPGLNRFKTSYVDTQKVKSIEDVCILDTEGMMNIWSNSRAWHVAISTATILSKLKQKEHLSGKEAFKYWAYKSDLKNWHDDPVAKINGIGINTFQYLRMMGGIDTVMPDRIVKRVFTEIMKEANLEFPSTDIEFILTVEQIARRTGYKATELCWMTWLRNKD